MIINLQKSVCPKFFTPKKHFSFFSSLFAAEKLLREQKNLSTPKIDQNCREKEK
jgi:hypothetical protein